MWFVKAVSTFFADKVHTYCSLITKILRTGPWAAPISLVLRWRFRRWVRLRESFSCTLVVKPRHVALGRGLACGGCRLFIALLVCAYWTLFGLFGGFVDRREERWGNTCVDTQIDVSVQVLVASVDKLSCDRRPRPMKLSRIVVNCATRLTRRHRSINE